MSSTYIVGRYIRTFSWTDRTEGGYGDRGNIVSRARDTNDRVTHSRGTGKEQKDSIVSQLLRSPLLGNLAPTALISSFWKAGTRFVPQRRRGSTLLEISAGSQVSLNNRVRTLGAGRNLRLKERREEKPLFRKVKRAHFTLGSARGDTVARRRLPTRHEFGVCLEVTKIPPREILAGAAKAGQRAFPLQDTQRLHQTFWVVPAASPAGHMLLA